MWIRSQYKTGIIKTDYIKVIKMRLEQKQVQMGFSLQ